MARMKFPSVDSRLCSPATVFVPEMLRRKPRSVSPARASAAAASSPPSPGPASTLESEGGDEGLEESVAAPASSEGRTDEPASLEEPGTGAPESEPEAFEVGLELAREHAAP